MKSEPDCRRVERTAGCVALKGVPITLHEQLINHQY